MKTKRHLTLTLLLIIGTLSLNVFGAGAQQMIYVKKEAAGNNTGGSWTDAYTDLAEALKSIPENTTTEIWVAKGTYKPTTTINRNDTFTIPEGVAVYGGFAGMETDRASRDWVTNQTILSGNIGEEGDNIDNCYPVVSLYGGTLDGFHITGGNNTSSGGGVWANGGTLTNNTIYGNTATSGGGVYADNVTLNNNTIYGNEATNNGGGIYAQVVTLTNNTIYNNTANNGGGVYADNVTLTNNTIYNNTANNGSGVYANGALLNNNILWENKLKGSNGGKDLFVHNNSASGSHNLIGEIGGDIFNGALPTADPLFVDPTNGDFRLQEGSPAIDAGDNTLYEDNDYPLTDATGRLRIQNDMIDIGAHEYPYLVADTKGILYVNASADITVDGYSADGSSWDNAALSLADALKYATTPTSGVKQIWVAQGTYYPEDRAAEVAYYNSPTTARDRAFVIPPGVNVYGGFAGGESSLADRDWVNNVTILSGDIDPIGDNDCYHVVIMIIHGDEPATLDGFTVTGGKADGETGISVNSTTLNQFDIGGVFVMGNATLTHNTIYGNTAQKDGGGVWVNGGTLTNNTIYNNTANNGGGVYAKVVTLTNNTIYNNTANNGGGVYANGALLNNNILWGNKLTNGNDQDFYGDEGDDGGPTTSGSCNLIGSMDVKSGASYDSSTDLTADPLFVDPTNGDFRLQEGSPAIDAGDNNAYKESYPDTDAAGNPRFYGKSIDIGAYEYQSADEVTYHTLTLEVAPGIDLYNYTAGTHQMADGDHLYLQFLAEDRTVTAEDVMLLIDGIDTPFKIPAGADTYYSYILNPITADHTVLIALREYTVTLPETEGITYDIGAGTHIVPYGAPFHFSITGDFNPEQLHVYNNGIEIQPNALRTTTLNYTIDRVIGPITITLEGNTTGNILLTQGIHVTVENGKLKVENKTANAVDVAVYTMSGQLVAQKVAPQGTTSISLAPGAYIVRAGTQTWKVIVND